VCLGEREAWHRRNSGGAAEFQRPCLTPPSAAPPNARLAWPTRTGARPQNPALPVPWRPRLPMRFARAHASTEASWSRPNQHDSCRWRPAPPLIKAHITVSREVVLAMAAERLSVSCRHRACHCWRLGPNPTRTATRWACLMSPPCRRHVAQKWDAAPGTPVWCGVETGESAKRRCFSP